MKHRLRQLIVVLSVVVGVLFVVFVINQTVQIVGLCRSIHPLCGEIAKYVFIALYALLVIFSVYYLWGLPRPLKWPDEKNSKEYKEFLLKIRGRLIQNKKLPAEWVDKRLRPQEIENDIQALEQAVREAEKELEQQANREIKTTAQTIFISTAVSQSGSLDGLMVLTGQVRMVWRIARIYNQRPAPQELVKLYANVAGTSFAARAIEDVDFAEIFEPVIGSFSGVAVINVVPVISILTNSILGGTANALLTLRTGIITRKYCSHFSYFESKRRYTDDRQLRKYIRVSAIREAAALLGEVIVTPSKQVFNTLLNALKKAKDIPGKVVDEVANVSKDIINRIAHLFKKKASDGAADSMV